MKRPTSIRWIKKVNSAREVFLVSYTTRKGVITCEEMTEFKVYREFYGMTPHLFTALLRSI